MTNPGDVVPYYDDFLVRQQDDTNKALQRAGAARVGQAMQIGAGGILINEGGSLTIEGTGSLHVGTGALDSAGSIAAATDITAGGDISADDDITAGGDVTATGALNGASLHVTGNSQTDGSATVGDVLTANAGISSSDARSRTGGSSLAGLWADGSGRFQINPSAARFKTGIEVWNADPSRLLQLRSVLYWLIDQDQNEPKQPGFIAEELIAAGFPEFVFYDEEGEVQGINYDRIVVLLLELAKYEDRRIETLENRVTAAGL